MQTQYEHCYVVTMIAYIHSNYPTYKETLIMYSAFSAAAMVRFPF